MSRRNRITRYDGIESRLDSPPEAKVVVDGLDPQKQPGHFWKFLALGPDGKLYLPTGAPCNICMPSPAHAQIRRINLDGSGAVPMTSVKERVLAALGR